MNQQWDLNEFTRHGSRLDGVIEQVNTAKSTCSALRAPTFMYGIIGSALFGITVASIEFDGQRVVDGLLEANQAAREGIRITHQLNQESELRGLDYSQSIDRALNQIEGSI